ncbi:MAG: hemerythrin domain-containing protein [Deltaproteobacteria bacterium]|nr:hemerythrin domain-containing protein [Deltaproteobacteria bacterium]
MKTVKATKKKSISEDVYEKLKQDHRKVEKIFKTLLDSDEEDVEVREENFRELKALLDAHTKAEEELFYPVTEEAETTRDLTLEAYEEHKIAKTLLAELDALNKDDEIWSAKIKVLSEAIKHHVKEEEQELFPKAKKVISKDEAIVLKEQVEEIEEEELEQHRIAS